MSMRKNCLLIESGQIDYGRALHLQKRIFQIKKEGKLKKDVLILLEHSPTITIGKRGSREEILADKSSLKRKGISVYEIGRGGRLTYHGPGQLVGYPLLDLTNYGKDLHLYLRNLEELIIRTLQDFDIQGRRRKGLTGVWIKSKKIASIGVEVKRWMSLHGFALNVNTDLDYFSFIQPCGMEAQIMTSMDKLTDKNLSVEEVARKLVSHFEDVFSVEVQRISLSSFLDTLE